LNISTLTYIGLLVFASLCVQAQTPGEAIFSSTCAACHGLDGRGGEHAPNIATASGIQSLSDQQLEKIVRDGIPAAGMPAFGATLGDRQVTRVLEYLRVLQGQGKTATLPGDPARGLRVFVGKAGCSSCHMVAGKGGFIGADLSAYGKTHAEPDIRAAILNPSKKGTVSVVTRDGTKYLGLTRNEDNFSLQILTPDGKFHFFEKTALARIDRETQSLMPVTELQKGELDDLISYLMKAPGIAVPGQGGDEDN
jgi:cytochrome c oxidase cbb3-type subunit III